MTGKTTQVQEDENNITNYQTAEIFENLAEESEQFRQSPIPGTVYEGEHGGRVVALDSNVKYQVMDQQTGEYETVTEEHFSDEQDLETIFNDLEEREQSRDSEATTNYDTTTY